MRSGPKSATLGMVRTDGALGKCIDAARQMMSLKFAQHAVHCDCLDAESWGCVSSVQVRCAIASISSWLSVVDTTIAMISVRYHDRCATSLAS